MDDDPRAAYFRQMKDGLYVRMALLDILRNYSIDRHKELVKLELEKRGYDGCMVNRY